MPTTSSTNTRAWHLRNIAMEKAALKRAHQGLSAFDRAAGFVPSRPLRCPGSGKCSYRANPYELSRKEATIKLPNNKTRYGRGAPFDDVM